MRRPFSAACLSSLVVGFLVLFGPRATCSLRLALLRTARDDPVLLDGARHVVRRDPRHDTTGHGVRVHVHRTIGPRPMPRRVVDKERVAAPFKPRGSPTPRCERGTDGNAEAIVNRRRHDEAAPRRDEHHPRVVVRHDDERRIGRQDLDVRTSADDEAWIRSQVAVARGDLTHPLRGVHHRVGVGEECASELLRPRHVRRHHPEHRREG